jgi:type I pantothenate kinase
MRKQFSPYLTFSRTEWAHLRASTPLPLAEADLAALRGINEDISLEEVADIYLPLSRLLNLYVSAIQSLHKATDTFLGSLPAKVPFVIGIAGSVAVGKSTMARVLQTLLSRWPHHARVDLVTTDGFLYPTAILEKRGLMNRKGFPESYDQRRLVRFLTEIKSGKGEVCAPVCSHLIYDVVPGATQTVRQPDILIVEGLNVLQSGRAMNVSDFSTSQFISMRTRRRSRAGTWRDSSGSAKLFSQSRFLLLSLLDVYHGRSDEESTLDLERDQRAESSRKYPAHA